MKIAIVLTILFLSTSVFTIISIPMGVSSTSTQSTLIKANYPIKIIQPQPNLNIKNRFYKAYPGIDYDVRIAVTGGEYPFTYSLTKSPTGMIINKDTGEISWANPTVSNSPYAVSAKVVGKNGASTSVQWNITVTTKGFYFLDAINGKTVTDGGTGTITNPWKTIGDMYGGNTYSSKYTSNYAGGFLYFKNGTYYSSDGYIENGNRLALTDYKKPLVWMAYPGNSPVLDLSGGYIAVYGGASNTYVEGFEIDNITNSARKGWQVESSGNDITFIKNDFHGLTNLAGGTNMACIFISRGSAGQRWAFINNKFHDNVGGMGIEAYKAENVLVEDNSFYNFSAGSGPSHGLGPKMSYQYWFIRHNKFWNNAGWNIWADGYTTYGETGNIEISYNLIQENTSSGYALQFNYDNGDMQNVYVFRNTFIGTVNVRFAKTGSNYSFYNNVFINKDNGLTCKNCVNQSVVASNNNLEGNLSSNIIGSNGNLTDAYLSSLGNRGYQIAKYPISPDEIFFSDGFESGNLKHKDKTSGAGWNTPSYGNLDSVTVSSDRAHSGTYSLKFHYHGDPDLSADAWAEQRYQTGHKQTDWYLKYYIYFPNNFYVRDATGADNNKIATVWGVDYKKSQVAFNMEMEKDNSVGFKLKRNEWPYDKLICSGKLAAGTNQPRFKFQNFKGKWTKMEFHYKMDDGSGNGRTQLWVNNKLVIDMENQSYIGAPCSPGYMLNGYLLGWANSGFTNDTTIYIDDVTFSNKYIGPANPTSPTGTLPSNTTSTQISVATQKNSTCKYSTTPNTPYASMAKSLTSGTTHSATVSVSDGNSYKFYVKCDDIDGEMQNYTISFNVAAGKSCGAVDASGDGVVDISEVMNYVVGWKAGQISIDEVVAAIREWEDGC